MYFFVFWLFVSVILLTSQMSVFLRNSKISREKISRMVQDVYELEKQQKHMQQELKRTENKTKELLKWLDEIDIQIIEEVQSLLGTYH